MNEIVTDTDEDPLLETVLEEVCDIALNTEERMAIALEKLTRDQLLALATRHASSGMLGAFIAHQCHTVISMRKARLYMAAHPNHAATWDQILAWNDKKGTT